MNAGQGSYVLETKLVASKEIRIYSVAKSFCNKDAYGKRKLENGIET